jgi:hypothetical protein
MRNVKEQKVFEVAQAPGGGTVDLRPMLERIRPFTMVPEESLVDLADLVKVILTSDTPGAFVECGVWRGGTSFLIADLLRRAGIRDRKVWLCDSFEGLPPPASIDGPAAIAFAQNTDSPFYFDNCRASLADVQQTAAKLGLSSYTEFLPGWFQDTLLTNRARIGPIGLLRLDGDWYASTLCCLEALYDQVVDGGFIILDDYFTYEGCAIAVHEFLGKRRLAHRIESVVGRWKGCEYPCSARIRKGDDPNWQWSHRLRLAARELTDLIPPGAKMILVDEDQLAGELMVGCQVVPFLEHDGQYWGPPPDDATALRELERLRQAGAIFFAVAWPAFWWLDYYADFDRHLWERYPCLLDNDRLVVFDLRSGGPER